MEKKIVVLIQPGLPFRRTIRYGDERAREIGATLVLLSISPEFDLGDRLALAAYEMAPFGTLEKSQGEDHQRFFQRALEYCREKSVVVECLLERGGIEETIRRVAGDRSVKMIVVPTPTKELRHEAFIDTLREFSHNMLEQDLFCPVISVLAT